jgi:hypothetical protein
MVSFKRVSTPEDDKRIDRDTRNYNRAMAKREKVAAQEAKGKKV